MSRVIGIISGKGGVGKTAIAANLGASLACVHGSKVAVIDANMNAAHLGFHFGVCPDGERTIRDALSRPSDSHRSVLVHDKTGVHMVVSPIDLFNQKMSPERLARVVQKIKPDYDFILLDCSPGMGADVVSVLSASDSILIVVTPDFPSVTDALKVNQLLEKTGKRVLGVVINKRTGMKHELSKSEVESICGHKVVAVVPSDDRIPRSISKGLPATFLYSSSRAGSQINSLAAKLVGRKYPTYGAIDPLIGPILRGRPRRSDFTSESGSVVQTPNGQDMEKVLLNVKEKLGRK